MRFLTTVLHCRASPLCVIAFWVGNSLLHVVPCIAGCLTASRASTRYVWPLIARPLSKSKLKIPPVIAKHPLEDKTTSGWEPLPAAPSAEKARPPCQPGESQNPVQKSSAL